MRITATRICVAARAAASIRTTQVSIRPGNSGGTEIVSLGADVCAARRQMLPDRSKFKGLCPKTALWRYPCW